MGEPERTAPALLGPQRADEHAQRRFGHERHPGKIQHDVRLARVDVPAQRGAQGIFVLPVHVAGHVEGGDAVPVRALDGEGSYGEPPSASSGRPAPRLRCLIGIAACWEMLPAHLSHLSHLSHMPLAPGLHIRGLTIIRTKNCIRDYRSPCVSLTSGEKRWLLAAAVAAAGVWRLALPSAFLHGNNYGSTHNSNSTDEGGRASAARLTQ